MKSPRHRVTLEHLTGKSPDAILHAPLQFESRNQDDIFSILERAPAASLFVDDENAAFIVGPKLFSESIPSHRDAPVHATTGRLR
ncbi:MAG: DUF3861 family protein [Moraxellaceae bacterium]